MAIEVRIHREFDDFKLDVQFQSESRRIGILGASGCGKSLTLKSIAGIERPETGKIESAGKVFLILQKKYGCCRRSEMSVTCFRITHFSRR